MSEPPSIETTPWKGDGGDGSTHDATTTTTTNSMTSSSAPKPKVPSRFRPDDELPNNVQEPEQQSCLPPECLSGNKARPLRHVDDRGNVYCYALKPMSYSVIFILSVELLERFSFYGIYYTLTMFLTGVYNDDWNPGYTSVDAASVVSISTAVAYSTPFVGAILADQYLGDYKSILLGAIGLYLPGILLLTLTTVPHLLGESFNNTALTLAVWFLWPAGTGCLKSIINVMGGKQFHPLLQSSLIETYYVNFYMTINCGALTGITLIPILAQSNVTTAYLIPVVMLTCGIVLFVYGTPRYVISKPRGDLCSVSSKQRGNISVGSSSSSLSSTIGLGTIFRISLLIVPFCIAYSQMPTTFIVQGTVMTKALGFIDAATISALDGLSVLVFGYLTGSKIYPALARRGIKLPTTYKFAIGSFLAALAILWALMVEFMIHRAYHLNKSQICVLWQAPAYILIGWGEIFAVSAAYEVAFTASPPDKKVLASAVNIFCVGGIPNVFCSFLYQGCQAFFRNTTRGDTNIQRIEDYATAHVSNYFSILMFILGFGIVVNILPCVRNYVDSIETKAAEIVKTPRMTPPTRKARGRADEESPLLSQSSTSRDQYYVKKFGKGPVLYKMNSMRAGPSLGHKAAKSQSIKYKFIPKLYRKKESSALSSTIKSTKSPSRGRGKIAMDQKAEQHNFDSTLSLPRYQHRDSI